MQIIDYPIKIKPSDNLLYAQGQKNQASPQNDNKDLYEYVVSSYFKHQSNKDLPKKC